MLACSIIIICGIHRLTAPVNYMSKRPLWYVIIYGQFSKFRQLTARRCHLMCNKYYTHHWLIVICLHCIKKGLTVTKFSNAPYICYGSKFQLSPNSNKTYRGWSGAKTNFLSWEESVFSILHYKKMCIKYPWIQHWKLQWHFTDGIKKVLTIAYLMLSNTSYGRSIMDPLSPVDGRISSCRIRVNSCAKHNQHLQTNQRQ